ncbi:MAG: DUF2807 domain-containing protein [Paramuribaculum sp.]|nr:DUF2807 domain-containing protein [Paramuribaculum sp.]
MTKVLTILAILLSTMTISAKVIIKDGGEIVTVPVKTTMGPITHIVAQSMIDIDYSDAPMCKAQLTGSENLIKYVVVRYNNGVLTVEYDDQIEMQGNNSMKLVISAPDVRIFETKSLGSISIQNSLDRKGKNVKIITNSIGNVTGLNINAEQVKLTTNSIGNIKVGDIKASEVTVSDQSLGAITVENILSPSVRLSTSSNGSVSTNKIVCDRLDVSLSSLGNITVKAANCKTLNATSSSLGNIKISDITATNVVARSGSNGDIVMSGVCESAELSASGLSSIIASDLKAKNVEATTSSIMAGISCHATKQLIEKKHSRSTIRNYAKAKSVVEID